MKDSLCPECFSAIIEEEQQNDEPEVCDMSFNQNPNSELNQSVVIGPREVEVPESLIGEAIEFRNEMMKYSCAIRELKTKLDIIAKTLF